MEESIGYEALFSPEEWASMDFADSVDFAIEEFDPGGEPVEGSHACRIYDPPGEIAGNESSFEIECDRCGTIGSASSETEAQAITRLHEAFVARVVDTWDIDCAAHRTSVESNDGSFDVICSDCGSVGGANDRDVAELLGRVHQRAGELASKAVAS